jgi:hypothetical protein
MASANRKIVNVGEVCTIEFAKKKGVFNKGTEDGNGYLTMDKTVIGYTNEDTYKLDLDKFNAYTCDLETDPTRPFTLCDVDTQKKVAYESCPYSSNNPFLSAEIKVDIIGQQNSICTLSKTSPLPGNTNYAFTYDAASETIQKPDSRIYFQRTAQSLCDERWHDWFTVPNYHLGNKWFNYQSDKLRDTQTVGICYKPCNLGEVPYENENRICMKREDYQGGLYANVFDYTPLALICLLGTTFNRYFDNSENSASFKKYLDKFITIDTTARSLEPLKYRIGDTTSYDDVIKLINTKLENKENPIWNDVKEDIKYNIYEMLKPVNITNYDFINKFIVVPRQIDIDLQITSFITVDRLKYAHSIAYNIYTMQNEASNKQNPNPSNYQTWRYDLQELTDLQEPYFKYLLRILKKSCNICFDGETSFSRNIVFDNGLNKAIPVTARIDSNSLYLKPFTIDETYDPAGRAYHVKNFKFLKKYKKDISKMIYERHIQQNQYFIDQLLKSNYLFMALLFCIIVYIGFYERINIVLNYILLSIVYTIIYILYFIPTLFKLMPANSYRVAQLEFVKFFMNMSERFHKNINIESIPKVVESILQSPNNIKLKPI